MTRAELLIELNIKPTMLRKWISEGLPFAWGKNPRRQIFDAEEVQAWLIAKGYAEPLPPEQTPPAEPFVLKSELETAEFFQISVKTFRQWRAKGCPGQSADRGKQNGRFPVPLIRAWIEENVKQHSQIATPESEQQKLFRVKRMQAELEYGEKKGELLKTDLVQRILLRMISESKSQIEQIQRRILKTLPANLDPAVKQNMRKQIQKTIHITFKSLDRTLLELADEVEREQTEFEEIPD